MAKSNIPVIEIADNGDFVKTVNEYLDEKKKRDLAQDNMDFLLKQIEKYTGVDKDEPKEGTLKLHSGNLTVNVEFKMNYKVDKEKALKLCDDKDLNPWDIFNIKVEYPTKTQQGTFENAEEDVQADIKKILAESATSSRGKSQLKITLKEKEN